MSIRVVSSMGSPVDKIEAKPINEPIFFEPYNYPISLFLHLNLRNFLKLISNDLRMSGSDEKINLSKLKDPVEDTKIVFLEFIDHISLFEFRIDDGFGNIIKQGDFALQLSIKVIIQVDEKSFCPICAFCQFVFIVDG